MQYKTVHLGCAEIVQGHWKWQQMKEHVRFHISEQCNFRCVVNCFWHQCIAKCNKRFSGRWHIVLSVSSIWTVGKSSALSCAICAINSTDTSLHWVVHGTAFLQHVFRPVRVAGLSDGELHTLLLSLVFTHYQRVTDIQTRLL